MAVPLAGICPYPTVSKSGELADGYLIAQPSLCKKCKARDCWTHASPVTTDTLQHFMCPKGFSLVLVRLSEKTLLCNGLLVALLNTTCPAPVRKANKSQRVCWQEIQKWCGAMSEVPRLIEAEADRRAQEAIVGLHDVKTAVSLVTRNAEAIIAGLPGASDEEQIENASPALKSLLKSVELLQTRLSMSSIVANPSAARHGQRHPTPVFKVFHRMVRLFEELAARRKVGIRMFGTSYGKPSCYDSFDTIPLVLIDNAVKYSREGKDVRVGINDVPGNKVRVTVESYGRLVPEEMRKTIFERGTRAPVSQSLTSQGSGLGLWIAKVVAEAHGFEITYESIVVDSPGQDGLNVFSFEMPFSP
ncbi:MAG: sensor histidine kinase [Planctomycetes bacterium]|nr:sensor histidine kinase [Planctomycetota bacterium]